MGWMKSTPPSKRPKQSKPTKAQQKQVRKQVSSAAKSIPGIKSGGKAKAADRYKDIAFPSRSIEKYKDAKPGGHLVWDKKTGEIAFPKKRGK